MTYFRYLNTQSQMLHEQYSEFIAAILDSPSAPALAAELQVALQEERKRRLQFYEEIDDEQKAEFINGELVIHSPVKKEHTDATKYLFKVLDTLVQIYKLGWVGIEKVMSSFSRNDYEPDIVFFKSEKSQHFQQGQWQYPVPDFVVEVLSASTEQNDRGVKFKDYADHGVEEYWIVDPIAQSVEQYLLEDGSYRLHLKAYRGLVESRVIKGFSIEIRAIFDEAANLEALRKLIER
jgi:Uma2 family endonuclease